jgi:hypothetical protein
LGGGADTLRPTLVLKWACCRHLVADGIGVEKVRKIMILCCKESQISDCEQLTLLSANPPGPVHAFSVVARIMEAVVIAVVIAEGYLRRIAATPVKTKSGLPFPGNLQPGLNC